MKQITTTYKTICLSAIVLLLAQGCIPTVPGGNPTPLNGFDINISSNTSTSAIGNSQTKTLYINGDSLVFSTSVIVGLLGGASHNFIVKPMSSDVYEYMANTQYSPYATPIAANIHINQNDLDTINKWVSINETNNEVYFGEGTILWPLNILQDVMPVNSERYVVFRKLKSTGYQYYWIKMKYTDELNLHLKYTLSILNGKYQMNSIVTGQ